MDRATPGQAPGSPSRLPRRRVLTAGLGLVAAACATPAIRGVTGHADPRPSPRGRTQRLPFAVFTFQNPLGDPAKAVAALHRFAPAVDWVNGTRMARSQQTAGYPASLQWGVGPETPYVPPQMFASLTAALGRAGFERARLAPGALSGFTTPDGAVYGLPLQIIPLGVLYSTIAFAAAGLAAPRPGWTIDDFENACAVIQDAAKAGRLPKPFYGPLPPMAGRAKIPMAQGGDLLWYGALANPDLWGAFALGYGGWVVRQGGFELTAPGTVEGIGRLADIARRYGAAVPRTDAERTAIGNGAVMQFRPYYGPYRVRGYRFARFPRLPVRPVNPATPQGVGLVRAAGIGAWHQSVPPGSAVPQAEDAAVTYAMWAYSVAREHPGSATALPPALADALVQQAYWSAPERSANGGEGVGDWRNNVVIQAGWPPTGAGSPGLSRTADIVLGALTDIVDDNVPVRSALADATQQLNAAAKPVG